MFIWTIWDALEVFFLLAFAIVFVCVCLHRVIQQGRCAHDGDVTETSACDAICRKCGANLGFIGTWRQKIRDAAGERSK